MQTAVGVFRECWGVQRPPVKVVQQRAKTLGYRYAQLYRIAGNWWLSLAMASCTDAVLGISVRVLPQAHCWILVKHGQGPLLVVWEQGRLQRVCQQSLADCVAESSAARTAGSSEEVQYLRHGWLDTLPEPWRDAADIDYDRSHRLVSLESLPQLPVYKTPRRRLQWLLALLLSVIVISAVYGWWLQQRPGIDKQQLAISNAPPASANTVNRQRLPLSAVIDRLMPLAKNRWQGAWQLQSLQLQGAQLIARYHGYAPLALYAMNDTDHIGAITAPQQPLLRSNVEDLSAHQQPLSKRLGRWRGDAFLRALLIENRSGLNVARRGERWQFSWQHWSLPQVNELSQRIAAAPLHLQQLVLTPSELGWDGNLTLTELPKVMP